MQKLLKLCTLSLMGISVTFIDLGFLQRALFSDPFKNSTVRICETRTMTARSDITMPESNGNFWTTFNYRSTHLAVSNFEKILFKKFLGSCNPTMIYYGRILKSVGK